MEMDALRSNIMKKGVSRATTRALLKSTGIKQEDIEKPWVAVVNSWNEIVPGHIHLNKLSEAIKKGILTQGGHPFEFHTIAVCDGICQGTEGMKYSLVSRDVITDSIEIMINAHGFDGMVLIPSCDKSIPAMLNAAARLNIPSIVITGGPMLPGEYNGNKITLVDMREYIGKFKSGVITETELLQIEEIACPSAGSCSMMGTANTMAALTEALGMSLPGCATSHAITKSKIQYAQETGKQIMNLVEKQIFPKQIMTMNALLNAITVDMAIGGSLNSVLHLTALANELGIELPLTLFDQISKETPLLCSLKPSGNNTLLDLDNAGGIPAVMAELNKKNKLILDCINITGLTLRELVNKWKNTDSQVIRSINNPFKKEGSIAVLFGNLAPKGAIVKQSAVKEEMKVHTGPARPFDSLEAALNAVWNDQIHSGDIIVVRFEGPKGGPGMREQHTIASLISGMDIDVALVTDGRFSGSSRGAAIGYVAPEAAAGGPIAIVQDGDIINYDIPNRKISLDLSQNEIQKRLNDFKYKRKEELKGILKKYSNLVTGSEKGAIF